MPAGASEEQIKELITKENYARYLKMTAPMSAIQVKADFSLKEVARQQGLSVSRDAVEHELVSMQLIKPEFNLSPNDV